MKKSKLFIFGIAFLFVLASCQKRGKLVNSWKITAVEAKIPISDSVKNAILTNGKEYRFYSDVALANTMDSKPFFVFDIESYSDNDIEGLLDFDARIINVIDIISKAQESVFIEDFENTFFKEMINPSPEFLKLIHKRMIFKTKYNEERIKELMNSSFI